MPSILDGSSGTALSILDAARTSYRGIGLSSRARALTSSYLSQSVGGLNTILGAGIAQNSTIEALQQKIKAIRASLPLSAISPDVIEAEGLDNGNAAASSTNGTNLDTEA